MKINYGALYVIAVGIFLLLDGLWLGVIAKKLYAAELKGLMTNDVKWAAAALFYVLFVGFLIYFAINPALQSQTGAMAYQRGALFGLATYATYDLTNYATLKGFPLKIVLIDLLWGTVLSAVVSGTTFMVYTRLAK